MVGLIKLLSTDTLTSVFSIFTAFTTEKYRIVINSFTVVDLKGLFQPTWIYGSMKMLKIRKKWKSQTITLAQFLSLMIATSSRSNEQWRTGSVSAQPSHARTVLLGTCAGVSRSQPHVVNSWNNMVLRPECVWTLLAAFPTHAPGPPDLPWYFGHSHPLLSASKLSHWNMSWKHRDSQNITPWHKPQWFVHLAHTLF